MVLTATNKTALDETKAIISSQAPKIGVHTVPGDLGDMTALPSLCSQLLEHLDTAKHQQCILVNNAGTLHDFDTPFLEENDPKKIQNYMDINVTSMFVLTTRFLSALPGVPQYVVQITSLLGSVFVPGYALYSVSRAARNAFMGMVGAEMPNARVLSYSPGPCDTDMFKSIPEKYRFVGVKVLKPEESISNLVRLLKEDKYKNGAIVDYFDTLE